MNHQDFHLQNTFFIIFQVPEPIPTSPNDYEIAIKSANIKQEVLQSNHDIAVARAYALNEGKDGGGKTVASSVHRHPSATNSAANSRIQSLAPSAVPSAMASAMPSALPSPMVLEIPK